MSTARGVPLSGLSEIVDGFDLVLCDIWGIVHNGVAANPTAVDALLRARRAGLTVVLVTNAPRPRETIAPQLDALSVPREAYDAIVTSGDVCRDIIAARGRSPVHVVGPERDRPLLAGLDIVEAGPDEAEYVLCTGLADDETETAQTYAPLLERYAARGLDMICANPDLVVERGGRIIPCAGSIALAYEERGGRVVYAGKPHLPIYEVAHRLGQDLAGRSMAKDRIVAVGDAIRTDIAGAERFGVTGVMAIGGIHAEELRPMSPQARADWFAAQSARPHYVLDMLNW